MTEQEKQRRVELVLASFREGMTPKCIMAETGLSKNFVYGTLKAHGLKHKKAPPPHKLDMPDKAVLEAVYQDHSISETARHFGTSNPTVRKWLKAYGIPVRTHKQECARAASKNQNFPQQDEFIDFYATANSSVAVQRHFKIGQATFYLLCEKYDVEPRRLGDSLSLVNKKKYESKRPDKATLITKIEELGQQKYVCDHFGVSVSVLRRWLQDYDISYPKFYRSAEEKDLFEYVSTLHDGWIHTDKQLIKPQEIDMINYDLGVAIEYGGIRWHSEWAGRGKYFHFDKYQQCKEAGIRLYTIFSSDNMEIVRGMLRNIHGLSRKIYARNCEAKQVSVSDRRAFFEANHLQGDVGASYAIGLYHDGELVYCVSFTKPRFNNGYDWEIARVAGKMDTVVVGGFSKAFANAEITGKIITYSDRRYGVGNVYAHAGFELVGETAPNYWYNKHQDKIYSRVKFQKHKLANLLDVFDPNLTEWENMQMNGWDRIWDCGSNVWTIEKRPR